MNGEMYLSVLYYGLLATGFLSSFFLFSELADLSQWVVQSKRAFTMRVWRYRRVLATVAAGCWIGATAIWLVRPETGSGWVLAGVIGVSAFLWYSGLLNPQLMFRPQQDTPRFGGIAEADKILDPDESVIVVEVRGDVRAYADRFVLQPHVVGSETVGGEDVVMTYCGLTNLGVAYSPVLGDRRLRLGVMTQLENNLVMFDAASDRPIQQMLGRPDGSDERLREWPTFRMPYKAFRRAFPEGRVFLNEPVPFGRNPFLAMWDRTVRWMQTMVVRHQATSPNPTFPTIRNIDGRLPPKTQVYGFGIGDDHVAYTVDFVKSQRNGIVNTVVGGTPVVVAWDDAFESLGVFYNTTGGPVTKIDIYGHCGDAALARVETLKAGPFWIVYANFFPDADINRVGDAGAAGFRATA